MSFEIDLETFNDLEIFTERGRGSIFSIFNTTRTEGGKRALKDMMAHPVSDPELLRQRKEAIRYFHETQTALEISYNQLEMIEHYLLFNKVPLRNNPLDALWNHWSNKVNETNDYYIISTGISKLIRLFRDISAVFTPTDHLLPPEFLCRRFASLQEFLNAKGLQEVLTGGKKLSCFALNRLDSGFRVRWKDQVREFLNLVYELDVYETVAGKLNRDGWILPEFHAETSRQVTIKGLRHPAMDDAVANDAEIGEDTAVIFLTGPNMGGKSSFLKSVGLAVYLAHLGFPVPAQEMKTPVFRGLITTINLPDNIHKGLSHYYSEVRRVKKTVLKVSEHDSMFVIFDELFRGTNFKDAYDASLSIISRLSRVRNSKFLISTHITELADELTETPGIAFRYFESYFSDGKPQFTYKIREGISTERLGMYIIREEGILSILDEIVERRA